MSFKKIMFDTNVFDKLPAIIEKIKSSTDRYEYYITTIQVHELCDIKDERIEIRKRNILMLADLRAKFVLLCAVVCGDHAIVGYSRLSSGEVFNKIINKSNNNYKDAMIAETSVFEGCTLITEDRALLNKMRSNEYSAMTLDELLAEIAGDDIE